MFPDNISQNIDILVVINVWKNNFGFHSNRKTQGQKHQVNNLYFKYQVCQMKLRHLNTFLQFRLLFHEPHCSSVGFSWSHATSEALDGPNEIFSLKSRWICLWECLIYYFIAKYKPSTQNSSIKCCRMLWKCCKNSIFELFVRYFSFFLCSIN